MSKPTIESSPSLTDLFEYDEYDSYENPYVEIDAYENLDEGIPLSVELSESISRQRDNSPHEIATSSAVTASDIDTDANNHFVRAPEIFLRIDNDVTTAAASATVSTEASKVKIKTECDRTGGSTESSGSDESILPASGCDFVELHYENEFIDVNAEECDDVGQMSTCQRSTTQFENDNEQLLFEGIHKKSFVFAYFFFTC